MLAYWDYSSNEPGIIIIADWRKRRISGWFRSLSTARRWAKDNGYKGIKRDSSTRWTVA